MKFVGKNRVSQYALSRVTPTSSLSDVDWKNETPYKRKAIARCSSTKIKYNFIAIAIGIIIAIIVLIVIIVPSSISKSTTTKSTVPVTSTLLITNMIVTPTNSITTTLSSTETTSTSTTSETTTIAYNSTISISLESTTSTNMVTSSTIISTSGTTTSTTTSTDTSTTASSTATSTSTSTTKSETTTSTSTTTSEITTSTSSTTSETTISTSSTTTTVNLTPLQWNTTGTIVAGSLSSTSATPNYIYFPIGIVIDSSNTLYVADAKHNRIQQFVLGNTTGRTVAGQSSGAVGSGASYLNYCNDVAVDSNGNVYVVDSYNNRVQLWYVNSSSGITVAGNGSAGGSFIQLNSTRGIAFDSNSGTFYVSDAYNHRVMSYTLNSTFGTLVAGGNGQGNNCTELNSPRGLYFDASTNSLIIANNGANNIVRWVIGDSNWTLIAGNLNGLAGNGSMELDNPYDVTLDPMGNVYVADRYNHRIQFFRAGEFNGSTIAGVTGQLGTGSAYLNTPLSVALDNQLNLYVSDTTNNRIQKFARYS